MYMSTGIATQTPIQSPQQIPPLIVPTAQHGTLTKLACKCSANDNADFLIKNDRIVCASCAHEVECAPPVLGIFKASCACCSSPAIKTTFVLDSKGAYVCTWCGATR